MGEEKKVLESIITSRLQEIKNLEYEVEQKSLKITDQFKEMILSIINFLDSFEKIDEIIIERGYAEVEEAKKTQKRYLTIKRKMLNFLRKYNVTQIEFPENKLIYGYCEVAETIADPSRPNDYIVDIVQNGYKHGDIVIREALVIIVKN